VTAAARAEGAALAVGVEEIMPFINPRFDGVAFTYAASRDDEACGPQARLLAATQYTLDPRGMVWQRRSTDGPPAPGGGVCVI
jgi:hypothetical protein